MRAADPDRAVGEHFHANGSCWTLDGQDLILPTNGRVFLLAVGKAASSMTSAALDRLGDQLSACIMIVPPPVDQVPARADCRVFAGGHPLPDENSLHAGRSVLEMLAGAHPEDTLLCLLSGGASAMLELPVEGIELDDLIEVTRLLLRSGAPIQDINCVRKAISQLKGGRLLSLAAPARVVTLIMSDVIGDDLADIGSGPTVPQPVSGSAARAILTRIGIWKKTPASVRRALSREQPDVRPHPRPLNVLIGSNRMVVAAARQAACDLGFETDIDPHPLQGEARIAGAALASRWIEQSQSALQPWASIYGGETTVTVSGDGLGGRNQELALSAALAIEGQGHLAVLSIATDGIDGPTDAAGAIVTPATASSIRSRGVDPQRALEAHDSYHALDAAGALIRTGPSGTNLNDLLVVLGYPA
jgi:glycerate 2-kinase